MTRMRIGIVLMAAVCGLVATTSPLAAQAPPMLTLAQAVDEALVKNDRLVNQHDTIEQADLGLRLARNTFQPCTPMAR